MTAVAYEVIHRTPDINEYLRLRSDAGLSPFSKEAAIKGLAGTIFAVLIQNKNMVIGMGRLIGDGGCFFQIVDIAVAPSHQGRGLGKIIMDELMTYVTNHLPSDAYISLIADVPANRLYEKYGFNETAPRSVAMARRAR